ncbi:hypothetical protein GLOIN_2v1572258 [Rhizophagus irregularis DAOM 181602=DAOM 197198]|uniref:Uncharacterized protein n=1 Tax=Rhizophagus irregularis (strain DAOM 181602 / DAOM 197198 / MUCL 43194) TaxID=747089 RepID=A0A2P4QB57_RHIID|nr:hypothetical protein GLOIN_2v1572258 [Rhizophagus irregularis DAOM 181602=DAOM 197198]POG74871.1 hypothetical protein GLOIN_2v1572258 [Rhizophagus irregularis DAOM 181602=DAOM 197198]GBC30678.2 hypothetical protein GLOIN_2v1572258 [Rhizophagus irregularis DAOM 181602=DAOM 197198]|eukprot:XP_025181737.1 hypothetical protein GLOIN_2v1572258 [Rhizophagus irregularis DAOM 181602=DAOM 197198]
MILSFYYVIDYYAEAASTVFKRFLSYYLLHECVHIFLLLGCSHYKFLNQELIILKLMKGHMIYNQNIIQHFQLPPFILPLIFSNFQYLNKFAFCNLSYCFFDGCHI